ncbi:MAG TPA: class I tRNA ligase family protein, partial [Lachnospiraceae bacterium]|nr:class I tRNA ligase family protein [Lachnospiraceae bacterium]
EEKGSDEHEWEKWWKSPEAEVYQFIGEDNIYFYGVAEMGLFMALQDGTPSVNPPNGQMHLPHLIANNHILFLDKKASSSSDIKPPMALELLNHYTAEQLRIHFLSLGLSTKSVSFQPKVYMDEQAEGVDTVLKEGNLLTNVFNRLVRSCFYTAQKYYDSKIPEGGVSAEILVESKETILEFEESMYNHEFHTLTYILDTYIRNANKYWVNNMRDAEKNDNHELRTRVLIDSFHYVRTATTLLHSIAPTGCEMIRDYLGASKDIWNWEFIFEPLSHFIDSTKNLKFLEPRIDFFQKHESQLGPIEK